MKNNFLKSSYILMIGEILTKLLGVLYLIPLYKINSGIGSIMANLFIPYGFVLIFAVIGINNVMTNEIGKYKEKDVMKLEAVLHNGLVFTLITSLISMFFLYFFANTIMNILTPNNPYLRQLTDGIKLLSIGILLFAITNYMRSILTGFGKLKIVSLSYLTEQIIKISLILFGVYYCLIFKNYELGSVVYVLVYATLISIFSTLILFLYSFKHYQYHHYFLKKYTISKKGILFISISGIIFFINGIFITIFDQFDIFMMFPFLHNLGYSSDKIELIKGIYFNWSLKLILIPISLSTAFYSSLIIQYNSLTSDERIEEIMKIFKIIFNYGILMMIAFIGLGDYIYTILYSNDALGIFLLKIQAILIPCYILRSSITIYLVLAGRKKNVVYNNIFLIFLKLFFNLILIFTCGKYLNVSLFIVASVSALTISTFLVIYKNRSLFSFKNITFNDYVIIILKSAIILFLNIGFKTIISPIHNAFLEGFFDGIIILLMLAIIFKNDIKQMFLKLKT